MTDVLARLNAALSDRYRVERELGTGGMAIVYLAHDEKLNRQVALKVLRPELASSIGAERFLREIEIAARLNHPNILGLYDCGEADGQLYYTMPFVSGESLRDRLEHEKQLPLEDALQITREVADALGYAHSMGLVHRDVKPENILLESGHALVTDFGIARAVTAASGKRLTETGIAVGTPTYMSPEQASGDSDIDARSDIYSLGCVLYEMLSGDAPFTASTPHAIIAKKLSEPTPRVAVVRESVPPGVEAALTRALAKIPADRFATAQQFVEALSRPSQVSGSVERTAVMAAARGGKRLPWLWGAGLVAVGAVVTTGVLVLRDGRAGVNGEVAADAIQRFVVVPFENRTGDPAASDWALTAAEFITRDIDRASLVDVVPASAVRDLVREAGSAAGLPLDEIARRTGASFGVAGSYSVASRRLRFDVEPVDTHSGELLRSLAPVDGPVDSLEQVMVLLATRVTAATAAMLNPGILAGWSSPPTLEAVTGLMATQDLFCRMRWQDAIDQAQETLQHAPGFPPLLLLMSMAHANLFHLHASDSVLALIEPLREQMTSDERLLQEWVHGTLYGDHAEATRAAEQLFRIRPADYGYFAGRTALITNRFDDALERMLAYDTESSCGRVWRIWWNQTADVYHMLGRYEEELEHARRGLELHPGWRPLIYHEMIAQAGLGRMGAVDSLLDLVADLPPQPLELGYMYSPAMQTTYVALELKALGRRQDYERVMDRALDWFGAQPSSALRDWRGQALYYAGRWSDADTLFAALIEDAPHNFEYRGYRGVALANLGRRAEALEIDRWLAQLDLPFLMRAEGTQWRAAIAAALGDRIGAVQLLQQAYQEGMQLGYLHHRDPEWESLRDYRAYQEFLTPEPV
jgi:tetratricopeptide (TPR) repeat protein/TolB-like protein